jgi:DNA-binding MarR family transcriptional regulator
MTRMSGAAWPSAAAAPTLRLVIHFLWRQMMSQSDNDPGRVHADGGLAILLARAGHRTLRAVGAAMAPYRVSVNQYVVLASLAASDDTSAGILAREAGVDSGAMTRLLDRMEALGLIERRIDRADRRVVRLHLTAHGRTLLPVLEAAALRVQEAFTHGHADEDIERFTRYLRAALDHVALPQEAS